MGVQKRELGYSQGLWNQIGFLESQQKKAGNLKIFKELRTPKGEFPTIEVEKTKHLLSPKRKIFNEKLSKMHRLWVKILKNNMIGHTYHNQTGDFLFSL